MVITTRFQEWCLRRAELLRLIAEESYETVWLCHIRIKILDYLLSRYANMPEAQAPATNENKAKTYERCDGLDYSGRHIADSQHPPKSSGVMKPMLSDIHDVNELVKEKQGLCPNYEVAYQWWRKTCCENN